MPWYKRPRNLLNEIQNVFINGKQVKTAKITQIIAPLTKYTYSFIQLRDFHNFTPKQRPSTHMPTCIRQKWPLHGDGQFASLQHLPTELSGCNQLTAPWNWVVQWVVNMSVFQHSLECLYSLTLV